MKMRRALLATSITGLIMIILLISLKEYYVAIALAVGTFIIGRREFWHLIRRRKLPPFDERIRENMGKAARNGFIFFAIASATLMMFFSINLTYVVRHNPVHAMGGLFLAGGLVYLVSYIFYDRVEPRLREDELKKLKTFLKVASIGAGAGISSIILHNAISALAGVEEAVFFVIAVILSPGAIAVGLIAGLVIYARGLLRKQLPQKAE